MSIKVQNVQFNQHETTFKKSNNVSGMISSSEIKSPVNLNYSNSLYANSISFKGLPAVSEIAPTLSNKVSATLKYMENTDLLLVGNNLKTSIAFLKKSLSNVDNVIKSLFFIEDKKVKAPIAIFKDGYGENVLLNLSDSNIYVKTHETPEPLAGGSPIDLFNGDTIYTLGVEKLFTINENSKIPITFVNDHAQRFNFFGTNTEEIAKLNSQNFDKFVGKTEALLPPAETKEPTFADVGGLDKEIKEIKKKIVYPIKYSGTLTGSHILLYGPPGTGKSLLAKALANEIGANYIHVDSPDLHEKWVGGPAEAVRKIAEDAKKKEPCVVFFDEIDAICKDRDTHEGKMHTNLTEQLLTIVNKIHDEGKKVYFVFATNKADILDPAFKRPKRAGTHIFVGLPDAKGCQQIFDIHSKKINLAEDVDKSVLAEKLFESKSTGADIEEIVDRARENAMDRVGIFEKMENGSFTSDDLSGLVVNKTDLNQAIDSLNKQKDIKTELNEVNEKAGFAAFIN